MLEAVCAYLLSLGYKNVSFDYCPDEGETRDTIALYCYSNPQPAVSTGHSTYYLQIQVRRDTGAAAERACRAIFALLDSGAEDEPIVLTPERWCLATPKTGPVLHARTETATTYRCEAAVWGAN